MPWFLKCDLLSFPSASSLHFCLLLSLSVTGTVLPYVLAVCGQNGVEGGRVCGPGACTWSHALQAAPLCCQPALQPMLVSPVKGIASPRKAGVRNK